MINLRKNALVFVALISIMLSLANQSFSLTILLKNGSSVSGEIVASDEYGLEFKCWGTDGILRLKWHHFNDEEISRLKNTLSLSPLMRDAYSIEGYKIYLKSGGVYEGVMIEKSSTHIKVKTIMGIKNTPVTDVLRLDNLKIDPLKIYTAQEWYIEKAKAFDLKNAADNFELAEYCRQFLKLYDKAKEHYNKAAQLSVSYKERAYQKIAALDNDVIRAKELEVERLLSNKDLKSLEQAKSIMAEWRKNTGLSAETIKIIDNLEKKVMEAEKSMASKSQKENVKKILQQHYSAIKSLVKKLCGQEMSYQDAASYINTMLYKQIVEKLSKDNKMTEEEIISILSDKSPEKYDNVPKRESSFGDGSWIANTEAQQQTPSMTPEEFAKYQKKIKAITDAKDKAVQKNELIAPEAWWTKASEIQKGYFLESLFIERYLYVIERKETPCSTCNGEGVITKNLCKRCWGTMVDIILIYK